MVVASVSMSAVLVVWVVIALEKFLDSPPSWLFLIDAAAWIVQASCFDVEDHHVASGMCDLLAAAYILRWWKGGGGDDFRKRRRRLGAKAKALFKKIKSFRPKPIRVPVPVPT